MLRGAAANANSTPTVSSLAHLERGTRIGHYEILELLGEGGFAEVYFAAVRGAEANGDESQRVALKLIKRGMDSREIVARFHSEFRTLQSLSHESIVQVFETGMTASGLPYFVMAQIDGLPVTEYCEAAELSLEARLELFLQICAAVQHAHQRGVLHRDLKPSNILVEETDARAVPKIIDFGVARALVPVGSGQTLVTQLGHVLGTPIYMSPEQAAGDEEGDTRADVYSLGAVLYEMLSGSPPHDAATLARLPSRDWSSHLRQPPPLASERCTELAAAKLRGDLDQILRKALAPDPEGRYRSAAAFADDVRNWVEDRPVTARAPTLDYLIGKFVVRYRWPVALAISIVVGIIATAGLGAMLAMKARQAATAALHEKDRAVIAEAQASAARERSEHRTYQAAIQLAQLHLDQQQPYLAAAKLRETPPALRGWEWGYLMGAIPAPELAARTRLTNPRLMSATPDGSVAAVAEANRVHIVDLRSNT
ncbi:MAG: serine/threonine protein kinase, partial [Verrucomicrobiota bacterium]|nr:serine/threonine protein kinase [Verrucomicrobiota bacterium]